MGGIKTIEPNSIREVGLNTPEGQRQPLNEDAKLVLPAMMIPSFRTSLAVERGVEKKLLIQTWGGLGDQICTEPTLRWAIKSFKGCEISLVSQCPELFAHLPFKEVFDLRKVQPHWKNYFVFNTIWPTTHLQWEFMSHMITHCVDYSALTAFRCQLPVADREPHVYPSAEEMEIARSFIGEKDVVLHCGRHWASKTFPKDWWDGVIDNLLSLGFRPVLIGANTDDNRGTVDVSTDGCLDLRSKTTVMECIALLQQSKVLITNDSSPLHMAATGDKCWIGFIATCKHPDYITHWRSGQWGYKQQNLGLGGIWDVIDYCPNKENEVTVENVDEALLRSWLPTPESVAQWAVEKHGQ